MAWFSCGVKRFLARLGQVLPAGRGILLDDRGLSYKGRRNDMLETKTLIDDVRKGLAALQSYIRPGGSLHLTDINIHAEDFVAGLLNAIHGWNLKNTNRAKSNYPCIDLLDEHCKLGVQVTSEEGSSKITEAIHCLNRHQLFTKIDKLKVFLLVSKRERYAIHAECPGVAFDWKQDVLDFDGVLKDVQSLTDLQRLRTVRNYVADALPDLFRGHREHSEPSQQRFGIRSHHGETVQVNIDSCEWHGPVRMPDWLAVTPQRMSDDWLVAQLTKRAELHLYYAKHWCEGTWIVVDIQTREGTVINLDQLRELMSTSATTTTTTTTPAPDSSTLEQPVSAVKLTHFPSNPLHRIIDLLTKYHCALSRVHHANTQEARLTSLDEWHSCHPDVWGSSSVRDDTIRKLADPAKAWLSQINCRYVHAEDFNLVEEGADVLSEFAVSASPMSMPDVYSKMYTTEDELWQQWKSQGGQYMALGSLIVRLKELAARTGQMWNPYPQAK
jgi:hypothetical protein